MKCKDIMTKSLNICDTSCSAQDAAHIMKEVNTGAVPIVDKNEKIIGIVTDRDITLKTVAEGKSPSDVKIKDLMTKNLVTVHEQDSIDEAVKKMREYKVRRVLVVNDENKLAGIISLGDIAVLSEMDEHQKLEALEEISQPLRWK